MFRLPDPIKIVCLPENYNLGAIQEKFWCVALSEFWMNIFRAVYRAFDFM